MSTVLVGCKLPHGIVLKGMAGQDIKLNGLNTALVHGSVGLTHVDSAEVDYLFAAYEDFAPFKSQAIFTYNTAKVADIRDMAADLAEVRTGFEGIDPTAPGSQLQPDGNLQKQLEAAERSGRPTKAPESAADKAAANELAGA